MSYHGFEYIGGCVGTFRRKIATLPRTDVDHALAFRHRERRHPRQRLRGKLLGPFALSKIELFRRQRLVDRTASRLLHRFAPRLVIVADLLVAFAHCVLGLRLDRERRTVEIIEQRIHLLDEQRLPVLHAGMAATFAHRLVKLIVAVRRAELRDVAHAEAANGLGRELEFRYRHEVERAHVEQRALRLGVERADRFQRVAEEVEPHRLVETRRKQIEDAATHGVFARLAHRRGAAVAVVFEPCRDGIHRHTVSRRDGQRLRRHSLPRRHTLHDGVDAGENDERLVAASCQTRQARQSGQTLRENTAMWRHTVVRLTVPTRKLHHRDIRREEFERAGELRHSRAVSTQHCEADGRRLLTCGHRPREIGDDQSLRTLGSIGKSQSAAGRKQRGRRADGRLHAGDPASVKALMRRKMPSA